MGYRYFCTFARDKVLYPFGHGLSYSKFVYEDLILNTDTMTADGAIEATVILRNDSDVAGKETVQLHMRTICCIPKNLS